MAINAEKQKQEKLIAVILILVLIPLVFWNVHRKMRARELRTSFEATSKLPLDAAAASVSPAESSSTPSELEAYVATLVWKRDPFVLGIGGEGGKMPTLQLKVSGIIFDETRPEATYAIINQEVVRIGDNFHGIKVIDIQPDYVRLKKFSEEVILYLYQGEENP